MTDYLTLTEAVEMLDLDSAEQVADLLRSAGAQQVDSNSRSCGCPVSVFVASCVGALVASSSHSILRGPVEDPSIPTPQAAAKFIERFDLNDPAFDDLRSSASALATS